MDNLIKNLYNRLYRKGLNISKDDIRAKVLEINPTGDLTEAEKDTVVFHFVDSANNITTVNAGKAGLPDEKPLDIYPKSDALTHREATGLVFQQIDSLNLELSNNQLKAISQEIVDQRLDEAGAISFIYDLIKKFVEQDEANFDSEIQETHQKTLQLVNESYQRRSEKTQQAFEKIGGDIKAAVQHYKSHNDDLKRFAMQCFQTQKSN